MPAWLPYVITAIVAIPIITLMLLSSAFIQRSLTAANAGGTKITVPMYNYFLEKAITMYSTELSGLLGSDVIGISSGNTLSETLRIMKSQSFDDSTGETMYDYAISLTDAWIADKVKLYNIAREDNYELPVTYQAEIQIDVDELYGTASSSGLSLEKYLKQKYGDSMTEAIYRKCLEIEYMNDAYAAYKKTTYSFTEDEIEEYYQGHSDMLDKFTYRYIHIPSGKDADEEKLEETLNTAKDIVSGSGSEQGFIREARKIDPEKYAEDDSTLRIYAGELLGSVYGAWLRDTTRVYGDMESFPMNAGAYAVFYISREVDKSASEDRLRQNEYNTWFAALPEVTIKHGFGINYVG